MVSPSQVPEQYQQKTSSRCEPAVTESRHIREEAVVAFKSDSKLSFGVFFLDLWILYAAKL